MGVKIKVTVNCCFCMNKHEAAIDMPDGWEHRYGGIDDEGSGFCPDHAAVAEFADSQCAGCVGGWGDCDMWSAFASSYRRTITERDLEIIESGVCPRRTNGTLSVSVGAGGVAFQDLDLSDRAPSASGKAFADAIREYIQKYPSK